MLLATNNILAKLSSQFVLVAALAAPVAALAQAPTITTVISTATRAGNNIVISGTNLGTVTAVTLNGLTMPIQSYGALGTSVTAKVPYEASSGKVRVTNPSGTALYGTPVGVNRTSSSFSFPQKTSTTTPLVTISSASGGYSTPVVTDLNQDGVLDLVVGNGNGTLTLYPQAAAKAVTFGTGTLLTASTTAAPTTFNTIDVSSYAKPTFADIDGNGLMDMLVGENYGTVKRYEQTAAKAATFIDRGVLIANPYGTISGTATNNGMYARPGVADLDNDGLLDILVGAYDGKIHHYEQTAANGSTFAATTPANLQVGTTDIAINTISKPLIMDLDGNGLLDMLVGSSSGTLAHYEQAASNSFAFVASSPAALATSGTTTIGTTQTGNYYSAPTLTDLDQDGYLDLIVGGNSTNNNTAGSGNIQRFQQGAQTVTTGPLPVQLTSFNGQAASLGNQLTWATASEVNSASFVVERSADGASFGSVGSVAAAGTSTTARSYQYLDAAAPAGASYYRLRQVDQDGTVAYSPVVVLTRSATGILAAAKPLAFPAPFTDALSVTLPGTEGPQAATVALLTLDGRTVYSRSLALSAAPQALAELPTLAPGLYLLRTTTAAGTTTQRITRQ